LFYVFYIVVTYLYDSLSLLHYFFAILWIYFITRCTTNLYQSQFGCCFVFVIKILARRVLLPRLTSSIRKTILTYGESR